MTSYFSVILGKPEAAKCKGCGRWVVERKRKPCANCGSINRSFERLVFESRSAEDNVS